MTWKGPDAPSEAWDGGGAFRTGSRARLSGTTARLHDNRRGQKQWTRRRRSTRNLDLGRQNVRKAGLLVVARWVLAVL